MARFSRVRFSCDIFLIAVNTVIVVAEFIVSLLSGLPDSQKYGFKNQTGEVSDIFFTQVYTYVARMTTCVHQSMNKYIYIISEKC